METTTTHANESWAISAAVLITGEDAKVGRRAKEILKGINRNCSCGAAPHAPDCNYERALSNSWDQALDEAYDEQSQEA
jgi:hypothetical protein